MGRYIFEEIKEIKNVKEISCGNHHTTLLMDDGTIKVAGQNLSGQLGLGDNMTRHEFVTVEGVSDVKEIDCVGNSTLLIMNNGQIKIAGEDEYLKESTNKFIEVGKTFLIRQFLFAIGE